MPGVSRRCIARERSPTPTARPLADKHHATYVAGINGKLDEKDQPPIADLMKIAKDKGYNNAGGGVYNHDMFWQAMAPKGKGGAPSAALSAAIDKSFGSMDKMKEEWEALAAPASTFGSGWVWLYVKGAARRGIFMRRRRVTIHTQARTSSWATRRTRTTRS